MPSLCECPRDVSCCILIRKMKNKVTETFLILLRIIIENRKMNPLKRILLLIVAFSLGSLLPSVIINIVSVLILVGIVLLGIYFKYEPFIISRIISIEETDRE